MNRDNETSPPIPVYWRFAAASTLVVTLAGTVNLLFASGQDTLLQELRVRELFAQQVFNVEQANKMLESSGSAIRISGEVDAIGNPTDDWIGFSHYMGVGKQNYSFATTLASYALLMGINGACLVYNLWRQSKGVQI